MKISKHAIDRCQQRAIPMNNIDLILHFGNPRYRPGGAVEYCVSKKDKNKICSQLKQLINKLDKIYNKSVLMMDGQVVTVYHKF